MLQGKQVSWLLNKLQGSQLPCFPCDVNAICTNTIGSYSCASHIRYSFDIPYESNAKDSGISASHVLLTSLHCCRLAWKYDTTDWLIGICCSSDAFIYCKVNDRTLAWIEHMCFCIILLLQTLMSVLWKGLVHRRLCALIHLDHSPV